MFFHFCVFILAIKMISCEVTNNSLVVFSYAGQEHRKTFLASKRIFEYSKLRKKRIKIEQFYKESGTGLGSAVWDGAFVLSEYLQREEPHNLKQKCVVEIGSGLGLVSIVASYLNATKVIATDGDVNLFPMIMRNMKINGVSAQYSNEIKDKVLILPLTWGNETEIKHVKNSCPDGLVDILLGADVVFEHDPEKQTKDNLHKSGLAFDSLLATLYLLSNEDTILFLAYKHRYKRENIFFSKLKNHFSLSAVPKEKIHPDFLSSQIKIYKLKPLKESILKNEL